MRRVGCGVWREKLLAAADVLYMNGLDFSVQQDICKRMVFVMAVYMPAWVYINCQFSVSRSGGDTMMGMLVDGVGHLFIALPGIFIMSKFTVLGPVAMYAIVKAVEFPKIRIASWWLKKEKWIVNLAAK